MASPLSSFERRALALMRATNETKIGKALQTGWLSAAVHPFVHTGISRRLFVIGGEWLRGYQPDRGVVLASNHRSFFDQWPLMLTVWREKWVKQIYFPVRGNFFYDTPGGVAINYLMGGGSMYPPVFRDPAKHELNKSAVDKINEFLRHPGNVVGVHPEGTRNKGDDPYSLLPAQPGVGQMALQARPIIVPAFTNGLSNDIVQAVRVSYKKDVRKTEPVIIALGEPVDYSEFTTQKPRAALYKRCSDHILSVIAELGEQERVIRQRCADGDISDDDPGWIANR